MLEKLAATLALPHHAGPSFRLANLVSCLLLSLAILVFSSVYRNDGGWLVDSQGKPLPHDFVNFYSAGMLVRQGKPGDADDWESHKEAQTALVGPHRKTFFPWPYPPIALPAAEILALPSYQTSFLGFAGFSLALCAAAAALIVGTPSAALWVAASSATFFNIYLGQNGMMTAALFGFGLLLLPKRPIAAGILFGILSFKPHLGLLLPVFLIVLGQWRAFASAAATVTAAVGVSLLIYGPEPWLAFLHQLGRVGGASMAAGYDAAFKFQSVFGIFRWLNLATGPGMIIHACMAAATVATAIWLWRADTSYPLKAAVLCTATALISPYLFVYDLTLLLIAQAFLIRHYYDRDGDLSVGMWMALLGLNGIVLLFPFAEWPTGLVATIVLAGILVAEVLTGGEKAEAPPLAATANSPL
jgi:hypothetical protein